MENCNAVKVTLETEPTSGIGMEQCQQLLHRFTITVNVHIKQRECAAVPSDPVLSRIRTLESLEDTGSNHDLDEEQYEFLSRYSQHDSLAECLA
ncbi:hypothetical protein E2C01_037374 [Portunus trituberculatus]|uniref:Uncharacterized protein n=1 Tax=Portunus trituberculatus TaxID=210409 RepID=A0A5B7FB91_PORTR|nr:hypothetical protein [Portunus trituberculatus]